MKRRAIWFALYAYPPCWRRQHGSYVRQMAEDAQASGRWSTLLIVIDLAANGLRQRLAWIAATRARTIGTAAIGTFAGAVAFLSLWMTLSPGQPQTGRDVATGGPGLPRVLASHGNQTTTTTTEAMTRVNPDNSPSRRNDVIAEVSLLRLPGRAADAFPANYAPPPSGAMLGVSADERALARKVPEASNTWVVPLETGGLALVTPRGGAAYSPSQVQTGDVVFVSNTGDEITVTGIVPDGTKAVGVTSRSGKTTRLTVDENGYSRTFRATNSGESPASITLFNGSRATRTNRLSA